MVPFAWSMGTRKKSEELFSLSALRPDERLKSLLAEINIASD